MPTATPVPSSSGNPGGGGRRSSPSTPTPNPVPMGGGLVQGGGAVLPNIVTLPTVAPPTPLPTAQPLAFVNLPPQAIAADTPQPLARDLLSAAGGMLAGDHFRLLIPAGLVSDAGADISIWPATTDGLPVLIGGLSLGDHPLEVRFADAAGGSAPATFGPPLTLIYTPTDSELSRADNDLERIAIAVATSSGWEPLTCTRAAGALTCSIAQPGVIVALIAPQASGLLDFDLPNGHFYKQGNGFSGAGDVGYAVLDDADAPFWSEFVRLGGTDQLGYPITRRFVYHGYLTQVFKDGALQWRPELGEVTLVNTLDDLSELGYDSWLDTQLQIPAASDWSADRELSADDVVSRHLGLLAAYPDLSDAVQANGLLDQYGLPTGTKVYGNTLVVRFERATLQLWTSDNGLGPAGTTLMSSGAQLGKQLGLWPPEVMTPELAPTAGGPGQQ